MTILNRCVVMFTLLLLSGSQVSGAPPKEPPLRGTIFEFPDLIKPSDATAYQGLEFVGVEERRMFDRRVDRADKYSVFLFKASFSDRQPIEVAVNREFKTQEKAQRQAEHYATAFGRLPLMLRKEIDALHIQAGHKLFGGGREVLIHTEMGEEYERDGILEETIGHEAAHALDRVHARSEKWRAAQTQDDHFISGYAKENPFREDIAESVIPYLAARKRPERTTAEKRAIIERTIPARLKYFEELGSTDFP